MMPFQLQRLGIVMEADPRNAREAGGVLNPGGARGPDWHLYLFPRFVAQGNFSRIGIARVRFNNDGDPIGGHVGGHQIGASHRHHGEARL